MKVFGPSIRFGQSLLTASLLAASLSACNLGDNRGEGDSLPQTMTLTAQVISPSEVRLEWTEHTEAVAGYDLYRDGVALNEYHLSGNSYPDTGAEPNKRYCYVVYAVVALTGSVAKSNGACVTTPTLDGWTIETVVTGTDPSLALDASNSPHVSYRNTGGVGLATRYSASWETSIVNADAGAFGDTDVQVDSNGGNHLSYWDYTLNNLKVASDTTGPWISLPLDVGANINALALDAEDASHIIYNGNETGSVSYVTNQSGNWMTQWLVGFSGGTVYDADILVDESGTVHAVFAIGSAQACDIYYMSNPGGNWSEQTVASNTNCGLALAKDSSGNLHIAYSTPFGMNYAHLDSGTWQIEELDSFTWIGGDRVALAVDSADDIHIAYRDNNEDLKYATNTSGSWVLVYVDAVGEVGYDPAIAVDPSGAVSIVYGDQTEGTVKLATRP